MFHVVKLWRLTTGGQLSPKEESCSHFPPKQKHALAISSIQAFPTAANTAFFSPQRLLERTKPQSPILTVNTTVPGFCEQDFTCVLRLWKCWAHSDNVSGWKVKTAYSLCPSSDLGFRNKKNLVYSYYTRSTHILKIDPCSCHLVPACQETPRGVTSLFVGSVNKWQTEGGERPRSRKIAAKYKHHWRGSLSLCYYHVLTVQDLKVESRRVFKPERRLPWILCAYKVARRSNILLVSTLMYSSHCLANVQHRDREEINQQTMQSWKDHKCSHDAQRGDCDKASLKYSMTGHKKMFRDTETSKRRD